MTTLEVSHLGVPEHQPPVQGISFTAAPGNITALFGREAAGARTILRAIAGLERTDAGDVRIEDVPLSAVPVERRGIGLVQRGAVLCPGTVRDNVRFGLDRQRWPRNDRDRRVAETLELVGMTGSEGDRVEALSDGERARV